ncbi:S41 family peptidase [Mastigocoleus testarum]|uniref:Tail specific protease domain-containing protein n=1 Tax=Mastigocoleus testarum BC008 TaxID=371196 RepID=A0A0V7ZEJ1_9CYAN|nr:S41 family peptidase [Mastigocoleus testarum]KST62980.1 hypothetical protein BC008_11735 [Mastigocoleus testarum BC008]
MPQLIFMKHFKIFISLTLFFISASSPVNSKKPPKSWAMLARKDLTAIKLILEKNHPGALDTANPKFIEWLENGYIKVSNLAKNSSSFGGYYFALRRYTDGFNDSHLSIKIPEEFQNEDNQWPNFALFLRNERFVVSDLSSLNLSDVANTEIPRVGDVLIGCDGKSAEEIFSTNVLPFYGIEGLADSRRDRAPLILFDEGNPYIKRPNQCIFENKSGQYSLNLNWRRISFEKKQQIFQHILKLKRPKIDFRKVKPGFFWITLSSFGTMRLSESGLEVDPEESKQLNGVIKTAKENRDALQKSKVIVFDMRGNTGGSSIWGSKLLDAIWGEGFIERLSGANVEAVEYRASPGNIAWMKKIQPKLAKIYGTNSDTINRYKEIIAGMKQALAKGENYYRIAGEVVSNEKAIRAGEITPKIYLLTNGGCSSTCLDFADLVMSIPKAELIGTETSADTEYIENRIAQLPSQKAWLYFSMKVYRGRVRGSNQPYLPTYRWNGKTWDTKELENWVLKLSSENI